MHNYVTLLLSLKQMGDRDQFSPQMVLCRITLQAVVSQSSSLKPNAVQSDCCTALSASVKITCC